jgi:hypothetical protein
MTKKERTDYIARWQGRKTSRITHFQDGNHEKVMMQLGDTRQNAVDTIRKQTDDDVNHDWDGVVPHQDNVDQNEKGEVTGIIDAIQKAIETVADSNPELSDSLKQLLTWASTSDVLTKTPGSPAVRKAVVNPNPTTSPPQVYPANSESRKGGSRRTVTADQLAQVPESTKNLIKKWEKLGLL